MRQILCDLKSGRLTLSDLPCPGVEPGHLLIGTRFSLVSQGTEKMLVNFGRASLLQKARSQPDRFRQILGKIKSDGLVPTLEAVFRRLDEPMPLGYANAGVILEVGAGVTRFSVGDRVVSNGPHAEVVCVAENLVAKIPENVADESAAFTVVGSIALQGTRLAQPTLGETVAVIGLGLIGQLTVQLLLASGCRVIGYDFDPVKVALARTFGVDAQCVSGEVDPVKHALIVTNGLGVDAVLITASTSSNEVMAQSARMSRKRGRIVLVGVVGLELNRADFYEKELSFQVSCSYGPGRYEDLYEGKGLDYPAAFVRWTENRNFQAVLEAMASGRLNVQPLISRRVSLENFSAIYDDLSGAGLASLLTYGHSPDCARTTTIKPRSFNASAGPLAIVGTGNFTKMTLLPALQRAGASIKYLASSSGVSSTHLARKYGIPISTTDYAAVLADTEVRGVILATRHNLHAAQAAAALRAGKHVLVEKPLCLSVAELAEVESALGSSPGVTLSVGFNRRFSPHVQKIRSLIGDSPGPLALTATMNAGVIPLKHWVHDPESGGGRLLGEACHFIDLAVFITGSLVTEVCANRLGGGGAPAGDTASILLRHANGASSVVNYLANGHRGYPKERVEVFTQERVLILDDFRETRGYGFRGFTRLKTSTDKGHTAQFAEFSRRMREGGTALIPWIELANVARATIAIDESLRRNGWVSISQDDHPRPV